MPAVFLDEAMKYGTAIVLDLPPVGIRIVREGDAVPEGAERFRGVSYCQAVLRATFGKEVLVLSDSIQVCQWAPVVLGFKEPENEFEKSIDIRFPAGTDSLYLAPITKFAGRRKPDVVVIRADAETYRTILTALGFESFIHYKDYGRDATALATFAEGPGRGFSAWAIRNGNRWLHWMNRFAWWQRTTTLLFRSTVITRIFDRFITRFMANMSICRNSTVIPLRTGLANISFFCTGGVAWGKNPSDFMTSGFPYGIYERLAPLLRYPGLPGYDAPEESALLMKRMRENASKIQGCVR